MMLAGVSSSRNGSLSGSAQIGTAQIGSTFAGPDGTPLQLVAEPVATATQMPGTSMVGAAAPGVSTYGSPGATTYSATGQTMLTGQTLFVEVVRAMGLQRMNHFTGDHPYVQCEVNHLDSRSHKTHAVTTPVSMGDTLNPIWGERLELQPWQPGEDLVFTVYDKGLIGSRTEGKAHLPSNMFYPNGFNGNLEISGVPGALLQIIIQPVGVPTGSYALGTSSGSAVVGQGGMVGAEAMLMTSAPAISMPTPTVSMPTPVATGMSAGAPGALTYSATGQTMVTGQTLFVEVVRAMGLQKMNHFTGDHPYVQCDVNHLDRRAHTTHAVTTPVSMGDTLNPFWGERLELQPWQPGEDLEFTVYDKGLIGSRTEGKAHLPSNMFYPNGFNGNLEISGVPGALLQIIIQPVGVATGSYALGASSAAMVSGGAMVGGETMVTQTPAMGMTYAAPTMSMPTPAVSMPNPVAAGMPVTIQPILTQQAPVMTAQPIMTQQAPVMSAQPFVTQQAPMMTAQPTCSAPQPTYSAPQAPQVQIVEKIVEVPQIEIREVEKQIMVPQIKERIVEVPRVELREVQKHVLVPQIQEVTKEVPRIEVQTVEKVVEIPQVQFQERIVEVPHVQTQEVIKHVPKIVVQEVVKHVPKIQVQSVEKVVEVTQVQYAERIVEVPEVQVQEVVKQVPRIEVQEVVKEVPIIKLQTVEKIVEVPQIQTVERIVEVPQFQEVPMPQVEQVQPVQTMQGSIQSMMQPLQTMQSGIQSMMQPVQTILGTTQSMTGAPGGVAYPSPTTYSAGTPTSGMTYSSNIAPPTTTFSPVGTTTSVAAPVTTMMGTPTPGMTYSSNIAPPTTTFSAVGTTTSVAAPVTTTVGTPTLGMTYSSNMAQPTTTFSPGTTTSVAAPVTTMIRSPSTYGAAQTAMPVQTYAAPATAYSGAAPTISSMPATAMPMQSYTAQTVSPTQTCASPTSPTNFQHLQTDSTGGSQIYGASGAFGFGAYKLAVCIMQAQNLKHMNHFTGDKPYVVCEVKHNSHRERRAMVQTKEVTTGDTLNPQWNESLELEPWHPGEKLEFTIYDKGLLGSKTEAKAELPGEMFFPNPNGWTGALPLANHPEMCLFVEVRVLGPSVTSS